MFLLAAMNHCVPTYNHAMNPRVPSCSHEPHVQTCSHGPPPLFLVAVMNPMFLLATMMFLFAASVPTCSQSPRALLQRRLPADAAPTLHILRPQRHPTEHGDVSPAALHLLLPARPEGPDRGRRVALLPHLPAQCHRQHPQDVRPHPLTR